MKSHGFTLWELLIVLILLGVMLLLASPSWQPMLQRNQVDSIVNPLASAIRFSRRSAITSDQDVALCGSSDQKTCDGSWNAGRLVITESGQVLRRSGALPSAYQLFWRSSFSRNDRLVFTPEGFTNGQQGSFYVCSHESPTLSGKIVVVAYTGRLRFSQDTAKLAVGCFDG